jgi:hypothetical protein
MHNKRIIAALAGVALTGALATTFEASAAAAPDQRVAVTSAKRTASLEQIHRFGLLGNLTSAVDSVARSAQAPTKPDAATLQAEITSVKTASAALQSDLSGSPTAVRQGATQRSLQTDLAQLQADLASLAAAIAAGDANAVTTALTAIAADLAAIVSDVTGTL